GAAPSAGQRRIALSRLTEWGEEDPPAPALVADVTLPGPGGPIGLRTYAPGQAPRPRRGMLFLHGGGWVAGDLDTHDGLCRRLATAAQAQVLAVDYRRAPEHPFPAALDDSFAAARWVVEHAAMLGLDPGGIGV